MNEKLQETLDLTLKKLDTISPSFCIAKWKHATLHLHSGMTHSCYHNPPHPVNLKSEHFLSTEEKMDHKKKMLQGEKPAGCQFCWNIESDSNSKSISDRIIKSSQDWAAPYLKEISEDPFSLNHQPSYLEISFSRECQMKCVYCGPQYSTAWETELNKNGPFKSLEHHFKKLTREQSDEIKQKFWSWIQSGIEQLSVLRITGGEPVLSEEFWLIFKKAHLLKRDSLFIINSNLSWPENIRHKLTEQLQALKNQRPDIKIKIITSLESIEQQAEMMRQGLHFKWFIENFYHFASLKALLDLSITSTVSRMSVNSYFQFLDYFLDTRKKNKNLNFTLDPSPLKKPDFLNISYMSPYEKPKLISDIKIILEKHETFIQPLEKVKLLALIGVLKQKIEAHLTLENFDVQYKSFLTELQKRYEQPFLENFLNHQQQTRDLYE